MYKMLAVRGLWIHVSAIGYDMVMMGAATDSAASSMVVSAALTGD
jgi:hypothetical protein